MENQPLVSVLTTAYNREKYIAEAIESVLVSTYKNFELIVVDDCSSDRTVEIARRYEQQDQRIKVYVNERNLGDYPNRNKASEYAKGQFIYYLDSDDTLEQSGLERIVKAMLSHSESGFGISYREEDKESILSSETALRKHFFEKSFLIHGPDGTIIKKSFFEKIGKYPTAYGPANDMFFNLKAASRTPVILLRESFLNYRIHEGQEQNNKYRYLYNNYRYLHDAIRELNLPVKEKELRWLDKKNKRRFTVNIIKYFFKTFNFGKTRRAIQLSDFRLKDAMIGIFHFD